MNTPSLQRRHARLYSLAVALLTFEAQVVLLDALSKPQNALLGGNPLDAVSMLGFFFAWTTGLNGSLALLAGGLCLLPLPAAAYSVCRRWLWRTR